MTWPELQRSAALLRLRAELLVWRRGWAWPASLGVVAVVASLWLFVVRPLEAESAALEQAARDLDAAKRVLVLQASVVPTPLESDRVAKLEAVLQPRSEASSQLRQIYRMAASHGLLLAQTEFQHGGGDVDGVERLLVNLPVQASYPQLRGFIAAVLREMPNTSMDRLSFKRNQVGQPQVEARLRLSLWYRVDDHLPRSSQLAVHRTEGRP